MTELRASVGLRIDPATPGLAQSYGVIHPPVFAPLGCSSFSMRYAPPVAAEVRPVRPRLTSVAVYAGAPGFASASYTVTSGRATYCSPPTKGVAATSPQRSMIRWAATPKRRHNGSFGVETIERVAMAPARKRNDGSPVGATAHGCSSASPSATGSRTVTTNMPVGSATSTPPCTRWLGIPIPARVSVSRIPAPGREIRPSAVSAAPAGAAAGTVSAPSAAIVPSTAAAPTRQRLIRCMPFVLRRSWSPGHRWPAGPAEI